MPAQLVCHFTRRQPANAELIEADSSTSNRIVQTTE